MTFYLLASHSQAGRDACEELIDKMHGKVGRTMSMSAYLQTRLRHARHEICPDGGRYAGQSAAAIDDPRRNT